MVKTDAKKVLQDLQTALGSNSIKPDMRKNGERLLQRLKSPVRVVILGPAGSGKSELVNFLAGTEIVPPGALWPTLKVSWGEAVETTLTRDNGDTEVIAGRAIDEIRDTKPTFVQVTTPAAFLQDICLLEVDTGHPPQGKPDAVQWAAERADIALWCAQDFSKSEQSLWAGVPDGLKDHSFFVLSQADLLSAKGDLADRIAGLQDVVAEEFHTLVPLATLQAIAAGRDGVVDQALLAASGGQALVAAISHQVEIGRQSDTDIARLFLRRHGLDQSDAPMPAVPNEAETATIDALEFLSGKTNKMDEVNADNPAEVLEFCVQTADGLTEILSNAETGDGPKIELLDTATQAADFMVLMQLEDGAGPAADAVTLLIQLRRDLEASITA